MSVGTLQLAALHLRLSMVVPLGISELLWMLDNLLFSCMNARLGKAAPKRLLAVVL